MSATVHFFAGFAVADAESFPMRTVASAAPLHSGTSNTSRASPNSLVVENGLLKEYPAIRSSIESPPGNLNAQIKTSTTSHFPAPPHPPVCFAIKNLWVYLKGESLFVVLPRIILNQLERVVDQAGVSW